MMRKIISAVLRRRLEDVIAVGVSLCLLVLFLTTRLFHSFSFGMHDLIFILLPVGALGVKTLLGMLSGGREVADAQVGPFQFIALTLQPFLKLIRDWFPFLLLSACYFSLFSNLILRVNSRTADAFLARIDAAMLGNQPSLLLEKFVHPWLTDFLSLVYFSFVFYLPGMALYFYARGDRPAFRRLMMGYLTLMLMGVLSYLLVPAVGPDKFLADRYAHDLLGKVVTRGVDYIMQNARVAHDCFPSLHVGIPLLLALFVRDYRRKWFPAALGYVGLMCCATVYLRYHYLIDVLAAFVYAPVAYRLNDFLLARWPGERLARPVAAARPVSEPEMVPALPRTQQP
jgi:membrane-associated phospholipid phosphatase